MKSLTLDGFGAFVLLRAFFEGAFHEREAETETSGRILTKMSATLRYHKRKEQP